MDVPGQLAGDDVAAEVDRGLEQPMVGGIDVVVMALDLHQPRRVRRGRRILCRQHAEMREEAPDAAFDEGDAGAIDGA